MRQRLHQPPKGSQSDPNTPEFSSGDLTGLRRSRGPAVDTPQFRTWFGGSKILDATGSPLVVYHGTPTGGFSVFEGKGKRDTGWLGEGVYFTRDRDLARSFTSGRSRDGSGVPRRQVYQVYLRVENPIHLLEMTPGWVAEALQEARRLVGRPSAALEWLEAELSEYRASFASGNQVAMARDLKHLGDPGYLARIMGHDGVLSDFEGGTILVFDPRQIKSATRNTGAYSTDSPDIRS